MSAKIKNPLNKDNLTELLAHLNFQETSNIWTRKYDNGASITVDFKKQTIRYDPVDTKFKNGEYPTITNPANGFVIHRDTTLNFSARENFVCLVCIHLLLAKGYEPKHIVLEPSFQVGHVNKPSYGDILVFDKKYNPLVLIENKTFGAEFSAEWNNMQKDGGQLFSYLGPLRNQIGACENIVLFASEFDDTLVLKSNIITLKDNDKRIAELENPLTFENSDSPFKVWEQTYAKSFETKGLFENDIAPYSIGKTKYTISDLNGLSHAEIRPIYHEFATILRNNAITDFEHSFYILIDLFLCKITDERNNPDDLQFYYKGISRDTPKEYCSRLLKLYKLGKKQLFGVDVINKEENDIQQIFDDTNRSVTNGLFDGIKALFEEIKFYNIKKFNFIDVENKEEFELNFQILIKITALIQDINLSNSETNHFFGDLFEGLLSKNVHQTEGQFFTPLPIVNFVIKSLPEFKNSKSVKVLDYACGAGHFLTEFIKTYPNAEVYGIEKSQPLSQVAKIATIINGAKDNTHIVFNDALSELNTLETRFNGFEKESFDCIIANPPYSVKGFLNTLTKKDKEQFALMQYVDDKALDSKKSIECFFVERAKYFLKPYGIMGIVLPSSILSNGDLYIKVRELLFESFNTLSIVSLGSRTFGSTGTNTIILFAQKVKKNSQGLVNVFISKQDYKQYTTHKSLDHYIKKQNFNEQDYFAFMQDEILSDELEKHEIFADYKKNFKKASIKKSLQNEWFKNSSFYISNIRENSKDYKNRLKDFLESPEYKKFEQDEYRRQFISFAKEIEKDKLNTFIQIESNNILILQSPPDKEGNKSNKAKIVEFLGYDWSNRKGDEGIKYVVDQSSKIDEDDSVGTDEDDSDITESINSIKYIKTPLYNPKDDYDYTKYAFALRKHICEQCSKRFSFDFENSEKLKEFFAGDEQNLHYAKLSDMLDFSRTEFDKAIKLNEIKQQVEFKSKFKNVNLKDYCKIIRGVTFDKSLQRQEQTKNIVLTADNISLDGHFIVKKEIFVANEVSFDKEKKLKQNDLFMCFSSGSRNHVGKLAMINHNTDYYAGGFMGIIRADNNYILPKFMYELLNYDSMRRIVNSSATGTNIFNLSNSIGEIKIPLPPLEIQKSIVSKCEKIDEEYEKAQQEIKKYKIEIESLFKESQNNNTTIYKLSNKDLFEISIGKRVLSTEMNDKYSIPVYSANVFESSGKINKLLIQNFEVPSVIWGIDGDWMVNVLPVGQKFYPTDHCGVLRIKGNQIEPKFLAWVLNKVGQIEGFKRSYRASIDRIKAISITLPALNMQKHCISQIDKLESEIDRAKKIMSTVANRKKTVLEKYLCESEEK